MAKGDTFESRVSEVKDDRAVNRTLQLTDNGAHNRHMYFCAPTFTDHGATLVYISSLGGSQNFYTMDLDTFESRQLTDAEGVFAGGAWFSTATREIFYWENTTLKTVNIDTLDERKVYDELYQGGYLSVSCDGKMVAFGAGCDVVPGFGEENKGHYALMVVSTDGEGRHPALVVPFPISHAQFSPVNPSRIIFAWEGPWRSVPQRIWTSDPEGLDAGPLGAQNPNECLGHEFFTSSGTLVGYHGSRFHVRQGEGQYSVEDTAWFVGLMSSDGTGNRQYECPGPTGHCQMSHDEDQFVCDQGGTFDPDRQSISLVRIYDGKCVLEPVFYHGSSWKTQGAHPHPRFHPDDKRVVFTTDYSGLSNIYMTQV
jgi:oligogalacturonide lyase